MAAMEMETDAGVTLRKLAAGDSMDYSTWPLLLAEVVSRIEKTAINDFPIPRIPQQAAPPPPPTPEPRFLAPLPPSSDAPEPPSSSCDPEAAPANSTAAISGPSNSDASPQDPNKENDPPLPSTPAAPAPAVELEPGTLPPQITAMVAEITGVLNEIFHTYPPHTIQRLSELVLEPRKHYKSLPAYLHAVDRVVHVTSGNNIYPLPPALSDMSHLQNANGATPDSTNAAREGSSASDVDKVVELPTQTIWGTSNSAGAPIGSDEALGGALLTPIPWLARRAAGGGDGSSESGESSNLGSEASSSGAPAATPTSSGAQSRQGRGAYEMQVRTESTETIDGPNGMGSIETVSVSINGVSSLSVAQQQRVISQGELIRQEQRAGVVPVNRSGPMVVTSSTSSTKEEAQPDSTMGEGDTDTAARESNSERSDDEMADDEEAPHARGPDLIGATDMGPQTGDHASTFSISHAGKPEVHGIDIEAAVGRRNESHVPQPARPAAAASDSSEDAVVLTPTSSEADLPSSAPDLESVEETVEKEEQEEPVEVKEEEKDDDDVIKQEEKSGEVPEDDTGPKSTTMSARSSPIKREAEDDISEAESGPKRLKSSTLDHEDGAPIHGSRSSESELAAAPEPVVKTEVEEGAAAAVAAELPQLESKDEIMEDIQGKGEPKPLEETIVKTEQAEGDGGEKEKQEAADPIPADPAE